MLEYCENKLKNKENLKHRINFRWTPYNLMAAILISDRSLSCNPPLLRCHKISAMVSNLLWILLTKSIIWIIAMKVKWSQIKICQAYINIWSLSIIANDMNISRQMKKSSQNAMKVLRCFSLSLHKIDFAFNSLSRNLSNLSISLINWILLL